MTFFFLFFLIFVLEGLSFGNVTVGYDFEELEALDSRFAEIIGGIIAFLIVERNQNVGDFHLFLAGSLGLEDRALDLIIGEGPSARSVRIDLPAFTLIGATTRAGLLATPLRDRFGIPVRLQFYTVAELERVVSRGSNLLGIGIDPGGAGEIARRSRGTPRVAGRLLRRVRDFAQVAGAEVITREVADSALTRLEVDSLGLDLQDRRYLSMIADIYKGGPVGIETLAAGLSEPRDTIEDVIEPYLIQLGLVARTARGRCLNDRGWQHLGLTPPTQGLPGLFATDENG